MKRNCHPVFPDRLVGVVEHYVLPTLKVLLLIGGVALGIALFQAIRFGVDKVL